MPDCPGRYQLVRWTVGELDDEEVRALEQHLAGCAACQGMAEELRANVATYRGRKPEHRAGLRRVLAEEEQPPQPARWWTGRRALGLSVAAAAAAALAVVVVGGLRTAAPPPTGYKGTISVQVVAKRGDKQFFVEPGRRLQQGDALRFVVTTARPGYLSVFSIDGNNRLSPFYPDAEPAKRPAPLRIDRPGRHPLPGSVILDDAPGPEHLFVVFSRRTFDRRAVHRRIARLAAGKAPGTIAGKTVGVEGDVFVLTVDKPATTE